MPQTNDNELLKDFKWIQEEATPTYARTEFEESPYVERTFGSLILGKLSDNILVPIGLLATTTCLVLGIANMGKGNHRQQQLYMRGRVAFQCMTFIAMGSGVLLTTMRARKKQKENQLEESNQQQIEQAKASV